MITSKDLYILLKKVAVGILVFLIPLVLIAGSLTLAARLLNPNSKNNSATHHKINQSVYNKY